MSPGKGPLELANIWITWNFVALKYLASLTPPSNDESSVYVEFKEQLMRDDESWYKIGLAWYGDHPVLPNNREGSLRRLGSLNKKLGHQNLTCEYTEVIEDQKKVGVVKRANET